MSKKFERTEIIKLIAKGFDLELISLELGISMEELNEYKKTLETQKTESEAVEMEEKEVVEATEDEKEEFKEQQLQQIDYEEIINRYKAEIASNPQRAEIKRNLLAFTYFKAGQIDKARKELEALIEETNNYRAYIQLIHIEKMEGNLEDAKLWAYEAIDNFPNSIELRRQLISMSEAENDDQEVIKQLKEIIKINPDNDEYKRKLKKFIGVKER